MGCCSGEEKQEGIAEIAQKRWPTDILFLILYFAMWGAIVLLWSMAKEAGGDPYKIVYGVDMNGEVCGIGNMTDKPFAAWPYAPYSMEFYEPKICVADCNETTNVDSEYMAVLYVSKPFGPYCTPDLEALLGGNDTNKTDMFASMMAGGESSDSEEGGYNDMLSSGAEAASRAISDIYETQYMILISGATCVFWVFFSIFVIRLLASYIVLAVCLMILAASGGCAFLILSFVMDPANELDEDTVLAGQIVGGIVGGIGVIFMLMLIFLRKQIQIAVEVVKEASRAIFAMPCLMFFPIIPALLGIAYMMFWMFVGFYVWSVTYLEPQPTPPEVLTQHPAFFPEKYLTVLGCESSGLCEASMNTSNPVIMQRFVRNDQWVYASFFHFFHMLWTIQFLIYFGYLVFAGATCDWYFTKNKDASGNRVRGSKPDDLTKWPVASSCCRTIKFHLGTVALCSLIIATVQLIRAIIKYIEKQSEGTPPNKIQKAIFAAIQCCLKCLECCLDKLNRNALIWTAVWGDGFCTAACSAFGLLWRNLHRVAAISVVSTILLKCTTFLICAFNAAMTFAFIEYSGMFEVQSPIAPCFVVFIVSYMVAMMFIEVFQAVIDTIFICFLVDLETNKSGEMCANDTLQKLVGKYEGESKAKADKEKARANRRPGHKEGGNKVTPVDDNGTDGPAPVI